MSSPSVLAPSEQINATTSFETTNDRSTPKSHKQRSKAMTGTRKTFEETKQSIAQAFLTELDTVVTKGRIAELTKTTGGVGITWTRRLNTTAGRAIWRRVTMPSKQPRGPKMSQEHKHHASIDLAEKVVDTESTLLNVLAHEFCHLATFMISGVTTNPHGKVFKSWAAKCSLAFEKRGVHVTTNHSYDIDFKYAWECTGCGSEWERHSKSIDIQRDRCGWCKSELKQTRPVPRKRTADSGGTRTPSKYQQFMKEQMRLIRKERPTITQQDLLKIVAERWTASKQLASKQGSAGPKSLRAPSPTNVVIDLT